MAWVAGADGFKGRWLVVCRHAESGEIRVHVVASFADLLSLPEAPVVVAVDIPIGLPEITMPGGRTCEQEARQVLGPRRSSVFPAVGRQTLTAASRAEADRLSRAAGGTGVGAQAWGLARKLREADRAMTPDHQILVHEIHPELSFWAMQGGVPMAAPKKTPVGHLARVEALVEAGFPRQALDDQLAGRRGARDDVVDACAAAWTATRVLSWAAGRFPHTPERDARGLDMAMWY